ncbi:Flagellin [Alphaproteobacteria bacterium SO-S41]|nr:Flagellin [Alphaproteobacteria bacterium SO-S41]
MVMSVNTNVGAMIALQNLNASSRELDMTQNRVSTGLKVMGAKDNASVYAIAQGMRADIGAMNAVTSSLNRAKSITDVALAGGETISDLLVQMKEKVIAANDASVDTTARAALNEDFKALRSQIASIVANSKFDGANLINGSVTTGIEMLADADATSAITLIPENLSVGGSILTIKSTTSLTTLAAASGALALVNASLSNVNSALARIGSIGKKVDQHLVFVGKLSDSLKGGVGNLVDADMAVESAKLQALQIKQQLGAQALSIANSAPQIILSLFQG